MKKAQDHLHRFACRFAGGLATLFLGVFPRLRGALLQLAGAFLGALPFFGNSFLVTAPVSIPTISSTSVFFTSILTTFP
jgi:hypothetical protein